MVSSAEIMDLKRIVAKNPKSLAFAWLADLLRMDRKLDEALLTANTGLEANANFLPGRLARGRILLEKGDLAGARDDFEAVAEQDSFCSCAQKLYLETSEKLGLPVESEVYQKILGALEPGVVVKVKVKAKAESAGVNAALDDLLSEGDSVDDKEDNVISDLLLQTFTNIFEPSKQEPPPDDIVPYTPPPAAAKPSPAAAKPPPPAPKPAAPAAPDLDSLISEQLKSKVDSVPDLTSDMDSLLASASSLPPVSGALTPASPPPDIDSLVSEQLKSKVDNAPDLTSDMDSLLASASALPPASAPKPAAAPDLDSLISEQLKSKVANAPDLTSDMDSLLASASALPPASAPKPAAAAPDIDSLINEQLKSKVDNVPDLTGDMDSLLASASDVLSASGILTAPNPSVPDIDALVNEQLTSRVDNIPDLSGDINSLLASMPAEPALEPPLSGGFSYPPITFPPVSSTPSAPSSPTTPDIDALVNEQLKSKVDSVPDLTGDINSLLTSNKPSTPSSPSPPDLDALINEQLTSKMENLPDLTGDISSLLASVPDSGAEPELMPYVPPTEADSSIAQKPTVTLAELYMDQGLPQKAAVVYKELLAKDPNNADLKAKLAIAEKQK
jgi:hypothetical protein